jgi:hypothetical protein
MLSALFSAWLVEGGMTVGDAILIASVTVPAVVVSVFVSTSVIDAFAVDWSNHGP